MLLVKGQLGMNPATRTSQNTHPQCTLHRSNQALLASGWGDEEADSGPLNPNYDSQRYTDYDEVRVTQ